MGREIAPLLVKVRRSGSGAVWLGMERLVKAVEVGLGSAWSGQSRRSGRGPVWSGVVGQGKAV